MFFRSSLLLKHVFDCLQDRSVHRFAIIAAFQGAYNKKKERLYTVYRPNTGLQPRQETLDEIKKKYKKVITLWLRGYLYKEVSVL